MQQPRLGAVACVRWRKRSAPWAVPALLAWPLGFLMLPIICVATPPDAGSQATIRGTAMASSPSNSTHSAEKYATLDAEFIYQENEGLRVRYSVRNTGKQDLAVFDRGNRHAVLTKQMSAGDVGQPHFRDDNGAVTLSLAARALPKPTPYLPPVPLAVKLPAGASVSGEFQFDLNLIDTAPTRIRLCVGIAAFNAQNYSDSYKADALEVWRASFAVVDHQRMLCTPWFDLASGKFQSPG